jgi:hypothetical protein
MENGGVSTAPCMKCYKYGYVGIMGKLARSQFLKVAGIFLFIIMCMSFLRFTHTPINVIS